MTCDKFHINDKTQQITVNINLDQNLEFIDFCTLLQQQILCRTFHLFCAMTKNPLPFLFLLLKSAHINKRTTGCNRTR